MTMHTVMGASPAPKLAICWGTLSSRMRKLPFGMWGMKRPLLSSTATSTFTTLVSTLKSGWSEIPNWSLRVNLDGILGCSASTGSPFLRGLATVSPTSFFGPSWPGSKKQRATRIATGRKTSFRMDNSFLEYSKPDALRREPVSGYSCTMRFRTLLFFALAPILAVAQTDADRLYKLFADYHENRLRETPELATSLGRNEYNHLWTDWSPAAQERRRAE